MVSKGKYRSSKETSVKIKIRKKWLTQKQESGNFSEVVDTAKVILLVGNGEGKRQTTLPAQNGAPETTRYRMRLSLRQPVYNWTVKDKCEELKKFEI